MSADKYPGPDGFSMLFCQHFWSFLETNLLCFFSDLYNGSSNLDRINYAVVALIPKVEWANLVNNFRPISLLNCICKIFPKVPAKGLGPFLEFSCS